MINYTKTTVFNTPSQAIVNTVNCLGVMGAGLALEFKLRYPQMYENYRQKCHEKQVTTGSLSTYKTEDNLLIINFPTKFNWRYPSKMEWLEEGLKYFTQHYQSWGIKSVAFPKLGCEHGGLDWQNVKILMEKYLTNLQDLDVYICLDSEFEPQGAEKVMLELLNQTKLWIEGLKINANISQKIIANLPKIKRFRHLQKTSGIGKETYQKLFQFLYCLAKQKTEKLEEVKINNQIVLEQKSLLSLVPKNHKHTEILTDNQLESHTKNNGTFSVEVKYQLTNSLYSPEANNQLTNSSYSPEENNQEVKTKTKSISKNNEQSCVQDHPKSSPENNSKVKNQTIKNKTVKSPISKSNLSNNNQSPSNKDLRIQLALILSELNIKVEEMRILTWDSLIKINDEYQIKLDKEKFIDIPLTIWQDLQQIKSLQNVTNNNELIISSKKKGKSNPNQPLAVNTIKKFISEGRNKQAQLQQLELPLGN